MSSVSGTRRTAMQRAADARKIVRIILKSLDREPVSVSRLAEEFGVDRETIRDDITVWVEAHGDDEPEDKAALLNWRDSHVAPKAFRARIVELAVQLMNGRGLSLQDTAETLGVDRQALSYWLKRAGVSANAGPSSRQLRGFATGNGDMTLSEHLESMRLEMIKDARASIADRLAEAEAI